MTINTNELNVKNNEGMSRFEADIDGHTAVAEYRRVGDRIIFTHTEVPEEIREQGIASRLVGRALDFARAYGLTVEPRCPFVASFIERHPEYQDLVAKA